MLPEWCAEPAPCGPFGCGVGIQIRRSGFVTGNLLVQAKLLVGLVLRLIADKEEIFLGVSQDKEAGAAAVRAADRVNIGRLPREVECYPSASRRVLRQRLPFTPFHVEGDFL